MQFGESDCLLAVMVHTRRIGVDGGIRALSLLVVLRDGWLDNGITTGFARIHCSRFDDRFCLHALGDLRSILRCDSTWLADESGDAPVCYR